MSINNEKNLLFGHCKHKSGGLTIKNKPKFYVIYSVSFWKKPGCNCTKGVWEEMKL